MLSDYNISQNKNFSLSSSVILSFYGMHIMYIYIYIYVHTVADLVELGGYIAPSPKPATVCTYVHICITLCACHKMIV